MKTTMFLLPLLAAACGAADAPQAAKTSPATNLFMSLRLLDAMINSNGLKPGISYVKSGDRWVRVGREFLYEAGPTRFVSSSVGVEMAERLNARAINAYRQGWEKHLAAPRSVPPPQLYPRAP
jgi:hypothetical protein